MIMVLMAVTTRRMEDCKNDNKKNNQNNYNNTNNPNNNNENVNNYMNDNYIIMIMMMIFLHSLSLLLPFPLQLCRLISHKNL